ncbi:MAG: ABC-F family ATP-binding cassette domain-containing protein [Devosiaceae bacterium]|nr:ABC-F family ATP-binding cassette domain-containing protein [Devosiaceae bacterium MH13]
MLEIDKLTYRLGDRLLFDGANAVIQRGAKVGFVGRNGSGKTTLFRLLRGEIGPESGEIRLPPRTRIGGVDQEVPAGPESLLDVVMAADTERATLMAEAETATDGLRIAEIQTRLADIDAHSAEARAARILKGLGFSDSAQRSPCSDFSGGWRMRVALAAVLFAAPDLLLLDEPTNYLDLEGALWLETYLARYPHTLIVISHDRDLLNSAVSQTLHLEGQRLQLYGGPFETFDKQRRLQLAVESKAQAKQAARKAHLQAFVDRFRAKATKARQAQSRLKMLSKMEPLAQRIDERVAPFHFDGPLKLKSPPLISGLNLAVGYEPETPILSDMTFRIDPDDRIALLGQNGNGKSTFAKLLAGRLKRQSGRLVHPAKMRVAFFTQHQLDDLNPKESPAMAVRARMPDAPEARIRARAAQMGFDRLRMETPAGQLSGGERARLLLGLITFGGSDLLILDEPTNHLDMESREALVEALTVYEGAVILISHDRHLIEATADRLWVIEGGGLSVYEDDLASYRRNVLTRFDGKGPVDKKARKAREKAKRREALAKSEQEPARKRSNPSTVRKQISDVEARLATIREKIGHIDEQLADPNLFARDAEKGARLAELRSQGEQALDKWETRWLELHALLEDEPTAAP